MDSLSKKTTEENVEFTCYLLEIRNNENKFAQKFARELLKGRLAQINLSSWVSISA
mgnify:CR=1 FL=1